MRAINGTFMAPLLLWLLVLCRIAPANTIHSKNGLQATHRRIAELPHLATHKFTVVLTNPPAFTGMCIDPPTHLLYIECVIRHYLKNSVRY